MAQDINIMEDTNTSNIVKTLTIHFINEISPMEIRKFRGAVISLVGEENTILYHNHDGIGLKYDYPKIQYKRNGKNAMILCVNEGTDAICDLFSAKNNSIKIGDRKMLMEVRQIEVDQHTVQICDTLLTYSLNDWLALNQMNYKKWQELDDIIEQTQFLEKILVGNILAFCKGVGIHLMKELICKITKAPQSQVVQFKNTPVMKFDICFKSNISLPDYIGLGKGVSIGFGMVKLINN